MYLQDGSFDPGDEEKVHRYKRKIAEWKRDIVDKQKSIHDSKQPTKQEISDAIFQLDNGFSGYWCQGDECKCELALGDS
jgi:hypothetical protein